MIFDKLLVAMASSLVFCVLALLAAVSAAPGTRLVGGEHTTIEEYPYLTALTYFYPGPGITVQRCVGSLLSSWHVLTTAFCFLGANLQRFEVRAGSTNSLSGGIVVTINQVTEYPEYVATPRSGDIAVVLLETPLGISNVVNVLYLPPAGTVIPDSTPLRVISWGFEYEGGPQLETLKTVVLDKVSVEDCETAYADSESVAISDNVICAHRSGQGTCFGDAGAPMVIGQVVVGTASYYEECGSDIYPDVFTKVDVYTNWIMSVAVSPRRDIEVPFPQARRAPVPL